MGKPIYTIKEMLFYLLVLVVGIILIVIVSNLSIQWVSFPIFDPPLPVVMEEWL